LLQVLELVLQNPDTSFGEETICSLLSSSKAIRKAAQQAGGPCSDIFLTGSTSDWRVVSRVASFAKWLPAHANLINRFEIELEPDSTEDFDPADRPRVAQHNVLDTMLALSMQRIAASSSSTSNAAATANQQQQQRPTFALHRFSSSIRHGADVISALPAASLKQLVWNLDVPSGEGQCRPAAMANALAQLTNLRRLRLQERLAGSWLPVIGQLKQLASLDILELDAHVDEVQHLPDSLVELCINEFVCRASERNEASDEDDGAGAEAAFGGGGGAAAAADADARDADSGDARQLDLSHLTRLTYLLLDLDMFSIQREQQPLRVEVLLPLQLLSLDISCDCCAVLPMINLSALQRLRHLTLTDCVESDASLLALIRLSALTHLELEYRAVLSEVQGGSAWAQLPQLRSLQLTSEGHEVDGGVGFRRVMRDLGAATSLRQLRLDFTDGVTLESMRPKLFGYLTGLQQLQELHFIGRYPRYDDDHSHADDAMHLTTLTGLTNLDLCGRLVGDVTAVALACHLSQLRELRLVECNLGSRASLPAIAKLRQLRHLNLSGNAMGSGDCLTLLTQLSALTSMRLESMYGNEPSRQEWADFWAAVGHCP
jgi:hypothetical protein